MLLETGALTRSVSFPPSAYSGPKDSWKAPTGFESHSIIFDIEWPSTLRIPKSLRHIQNTLMHVRHPAEKLLRGLAFANQRNRDGYGSSNLTLGYEHGEP